VPLGTEVGLGPGDIVLDGDPDPLRKWHRSPHFSAHVYCGQTAGWIRIPLGREVCIGPGDVRREPSSPTERGTAAPLTFLPTLLWHSRPIQLLLSTCCTARGREFLYFTMGHHFSHQNCPLPWRGLDPHLIHGSLGPPESSTHTASDLDRLSGFAGLTSVTDRPTDRQQTDRPRHSVGNKRPHLRT